MFQSCSRSEGRAGAAGEADPFAGGGVDRRTSTRSGAARRRAATGGAGCGRARDGAGDATFGGSCGAGGSRIRTRRGVLVSIECFGDANTNNPRSPAWSTSEIVIDLARMD